MTKHIKQRLSVKIFIITFLLLGAACSGTYFFISKLLPTTYSNLINAATEKAAIHHISDDGKYLIMGNGTRAFAVAAEQPEKDNPLRTAEMTLEDDYGMIDGVINNGRRGEELEKAQEYADRTTPEKPSIRERLEDAKRECAEHKPPEGKKPGRDVPEHDCL